MSFVTPFLLALGLLTLPVVLALHLLRQRRRRVRVPALDLWHDPSPTVQQSPRELPITLPLILRLLVALALAVALGRPLIQNLGHRPTTTVLIIDTSTSMAATDAAPSRFVTAQATARGLIEALRPGDELALIALANPPQLVVHGDAASRASLEAALAGLIPAGGDGDVQAALNLATAVVNQQHAPRVVVLTDQSFHAGDPATAPGPVEWRTFGSSGENSGFAAFAARATRNGTQLYARVRNFGQRPIARTLTLRLDDQVAATETVRLAPGIEAEWSWPLPAGVRVATASLGDHDALPDDDEQVALIQNTTGTRVLLVSEGQSPMERALRALPGVTVTTATPTTYATAGSDLVIFYRFVPETLPPVPVWLVAPPTSTLLPFKSTRSNVEADQVNDPRFASVDLKPIRFDRVAQIQPPSWASVAIGAGSTPLVLTGVQQGQLLAVWTFDPEASALANRLQFPLLTVATLRAMTGTATRSYAPGDPAPQALIAPNGRQVDAHAPLPAPGIYRKADQQPALAANVLDPRESNLAQQSQPAITVVPVSGSPRSTSVGQETWGVLILLVVLGLLGESIYANRHRFGRLRKAVRL